MAVKVHPILKRSKIRSLSYIDIRKLSLTAGKPPNVVDEVACLAWLSAAGLEMGCLSSVKKYISLMKSKGGYTYGGRRERHAFERLAKELGITFGTKRKEKKPRPKAGSAYYSPYQRRSRQHFSTEALIQRFNDWKGNDGPAVYRFCRVHGVRLAFTQIVRQVNDRLIIATLTGNGQGHALLTIPDVPDASRINATYKFGTCPFPILE